MPQNENMINLFSGFNGRPVLTLVLFLAASMFLLRRTLKQTCKLELIALGFGVCVFFECVRLLLTRAGASHLCILYRLLGEPNTVKYRVDVQS